MNGIDERGFSTKLVNCLRMLISTDKYGGVGTNKKLLAAMIVRIPNEMVNSHALSEAEKTAALQRVFTEVMTSCAFSKKKKPKANALRRDLLEELKTFADFRILVLSCFLMRFSEETLKLMPSRDAVFARPFAVKHLGEKGIAGMSDYFLVWDKYGQEGCINKEQLVNEEATKTLKASSWLDGLTEEECESAKRVFHQELERRNGQKRKSRAGHSVQDALDHALTSFGILFGGQSHPKRDLELDRDVQVGDGWKVGISCKRTKRERVKQVAADAEKMKEYKLRHMFHISTFDNDLAADMIALLGKYGHYFYLSDGSEEYLRLIDEPLTRDYVRPTSSLINDLQELKKNPRYLIDLKVAPVAETELALG